MVIKHPYLNEKTSRVASQASVLSHGADDDGGGGGGGGRGPVGPTGGRTGGLGFSPEPGYGRHPVMPSRQGRHPILVAARGLRG